MEFDVIATRQDAGEGALSGLAVAESCKRTNPLYTVAETNTNKIVFSLELATAAASRHSHKPSGNQ